MRLRLSPICLAFCLAAHGALAQGTTSLQPEPGPGFTTGLCTRGNLLGDAGGLRSALWNYGITFGIQDTNEVWGNVTGGIKRGASLRRGHPDERRPGYATSLRLGRRHLQRQRLEHPRSQHQHRQPAEPADGERHSRCPDHTAVGGLVPAIVPRRQVRREDRSAEPRPGVHDQSGLGHCSSTP